MLLPLHERLQGVVHILEKDNEKLKTIGAAGYLAYDPATLRDALLHLLDAVALPKTSLDLGCGNGGWLLLAAAAGFSSYGIEINPKLLEHCRRNYELCVQLGYIDPATTCRWIEGDMIPPKHRKAYEEFAKEHPEVGRSMPLMHSTANMYPQLGIGISTADIVYTWSWPTQSRFLFNMLQKEAKDDAIFVLPSYVRYTQGEHMNAYIKARNELFLEPICKTAVDVFIGKRAQN
jgi:hypothetical protein